MRKPAFKDVILSCFLPGARSLLHSKAPGRFVDVCVTVGDLNIFRRPSSPYLPFLDPDTSCIDLSNEIGSHIYPLHALQFTTEFDDPPPLELLYKLQSLTIAHSKFVLLLQSLAHSSRRPVEPELEYNSPRRSNLQIPPPGIKRLYFPEPLYYSASPAIHRTPSFNRYKRSQCVQVVTGESRPPAKKRSFLVRSKQPLPPPSLDFLIRQSYFSPWRRTLQSSSSITMSELTLPRRRRFHNTSSMSDSSLSTSAPLSMIQESRGSPSALRILTPLQSPHNIHLATSRSHAPILRVFEPCSELNDTSIAACENQLSDAGLWDHLSVGDVVCNLGYVPPSPLQEYDPMEDFGALTSASLRSRHSSLGNRSATDDTAWLVYDGFGLVQYSPATEPPPLKDALALVTPYYYSHILPGSAHPFFTLDLYSRLARFRGFVNDPRGNVFPPPIPPKFELITVLTRVRSPHSAGGYAMVKSYKWVATIKGIKTAISGDAEVGIGWLTDQWVLEVDGTLEGRRMLDSLLTPLAPHIAGDWARGDLVWEVDRQRSNFHKTWFRCVHFRLTPSHVGGY